MNQKNKKRNTFIVFEILLREQTDSYLKGDLKKHTKIDDIFKKYFTKDKELGKEIELYFEILNYRDNFKEKSEQLNEKMFSLVKEEYKKLNKTKIFNEQTNLITELDQTFGKDIFSTFLPEYKILMNLYSFMDDSMSIMEKLEAKNRFSAILEKKEEKDHLEYIDNIVFYKLAEKFNTKYKDLLPEQKQLISKYVSAFGENTVDFIFFLNEEVSRLINILNENKDNDLFKSNNLFGEKIDLIVKKLNIFKNTKNITESMMESLLKTQNLINEILNEN